MNDDQHQDGPETNDLPLEAPEPSSTPAEPGDDNLDTESDTSEVAKLRREAAGHRSKLREAEAERDALRVQHDALAAMVLEDALKPHGVTPELFAAAGRSLEEFVSDGALDRSALTAAVRDTAKAYGIRAGRSPWTGTGDERPVKGASWDDVIKH